jgi:hypothetical protein
MEQRVLFFSSLGHWPICVETCRMLDAVFPNTFFAELVNIDKRCGRARLPLPSLKAGVLLVGAVKDIPFTVVVRPPRFALSSCSRRRCYPGEGRGVGAATHLISVVCETATPNKH